MKKIFLFVISVLTTTIASADSGTSGLSDAADGVVTYMPYVRALCYVIAALIAIVGAVAVYYTMQTNPQNTTKRILMTGCGALTFVCLSLALPQFFGIDGNVSSSGSSAGAGTEEQEALTMAFLRR
jgi:zinc transporter ZupT